jgi:hypothetical protein
VIFAPDGKIASYRVDHLKWTIQPRMRSSVYMSDEELKDRGLQKVEKKFGPTRK